jgi:hypothetical protein
MLAKVLKPFPYAHDGRTPSRSAAGDVVDIDASVTSTACTPRASSRKPPTRSSRPPRPAPWSLPPPGRDPGRLGDGLHWFKLKRPGRARSPAAPVTNKVAAVGLDRSRRGRPRLGRRLSRCSRTWSSPPRARAELVTPRRGEGAPAAWRAATTGTTGCRRLPRHRDGPARRLRRRARPGAGAQTWTLYLDRFPAASPAAGRTATPSACRCRR